ncbi:MAG TPA: AAA family ATPase [Verrucomicrobiae bacterium]|jgi:proteasome-associated ATPase
MTTTETNGGKTVYPLSLATVIRVASRKPLSSAERLGRKGALVKIKKDSKYFGLQPGAEGVGEVIGMKDDEVGWAYVLFPSGYKNRYRIGLPLAADGACDLELAEAENEKFAVVSFGGQWLEFPVDGFDVQPGDMLKLARDPLAVAGVEQGAASGSVAFVAQSLDGDMALVDFQGNRKTVFAGKFAGQLEPSGKVVLDSTGTVIIGNFGLEDDSFSVDQTEPVAWDDICGQEEAKNRFMDALEKPALHPGHYQFFGKKPPAGVLLYGPPGCSKTMFGKAIYASITAACAAKGARASQGFILVSGPEILDKYVGVPEATIRHVFARARKFFQKTGLRPVIFLDEAESILAKRDSGISSDVLRTIVPAFLAEMQGVRQSGALVIIATNKPESLDYAAIREGRIDVKLRIGRPDRKAAREIFVKNMSRVPVSQTATIGKLADAFTEELFSPKRVIYEIQREAAEGAVTTVYFTLADIVSGAMIPVMVEEAKRLALERELAKPQASEGVRLEDVVAAVESVYRQSFASDHVEALRDFTHDFADSVREVKKLKQAQI